MVMKTEDMKQRKYGENESSVEETAVLMGKLAAVLWRPKHRKYMGKEEEDQIVRGIIGETLWQVFSNNHVVVNDKTGQAMISGSWRYAGGMVAEVIEKVYGVTGQDYLTYYCSESTGGWTLKAVRELARMGYAVYDFDEVYERTV